MKRRVILAAYALSLCAWFWTQSRYPALNMKALMGDRSSVSTLSFDIIYPILAGDSWLLRILKSTVNWYFTNWKGMTFGLLFSGALLPLLPLLRFRGFRSPWLNVLGGVFTGAPLGVCANCVAPISLSVYRSGMRTEWALATLFSSPTLNVVAVGMSFAMFPPLFAVLKLSLLAVLLLGIVPWIARLGRPPLQEAEAAACVPEAPAAPKEGWLSAVAGAGGDVLRGTGRVVLLTVPLMLLSGLLGAGVAELLPMGALQSLTVSLPALIITALVGTLLPVPMTFDIVMTAILMGAGLPGAYSMALLFTLGTFSIYPFLLLWTRVSRPVALAAFASVALLGLTGGLVADRVLAHRLDTVAGLALNFEAMARESARQTVRETCGLLEGEMARNCQFRAATMTRLSDLCEGLEDPARNRCLGIVVARGSPNDPGPCLQVKDMEAREACVAHSFQAFADGKVNTKYSLQFQTFCRANQNEFNVPCRGLLRAGRMVRGGDPAGCLRKKDPANRALCEDQVNASRAIFLADPSLCEKIHDEKRRSACRGRADVGTLAREPADCLARDGAESKASCLAGLAANRIARVYSAMLLHADIGTSAQGRETASLDAIEAEPPFKPRELQAKGGATLWAAAHRERGGRGEKLFRKIEGPAAGIVLPPVSVIELASADVRYGRGVAAGDFDRDGWIDIAFATPEGPALFRNVGGARFTRAPWRLGDGQEGKEKQFREAQLVAFVDMNNDGFLDLFVATNGGQSGFLMNRQGSFLDAGVLPLENPTLSFTRAAAFFDLNRDGFLDAFLGNWTSGSATFQKKESEDKLYVSEAGKLLPSTLYRDSVLGETLSVLSSDVNQDGHADLLIANDYGPADEIYLGQPGGRLARLKDASVVPYVSRSNMSWESADVNNDLRLDLFSVDIDFAFQGKNQGPYCSFIENQEERLECEDSLRALDASTAMSVNDCLELRSAAKRVSCLSHIMISLSVSRSDSGRCAAFEAAYPELSRLCRIRTARGRGSLALPDGSHVPQQARNVLLVQGAGGKFTAKEKEFGIDKSSWAWNAKFADLDEDGWQDLYVATGADKFDDGNHGFAFRNVEGKKFQRAPETGLEQPFNSSSYVYADIDRDGDLDIVSNSVFGPAMIFLNGSKAGSVTISVEDKNRSVIGANVVIEDAQGRRQLRELKASGGYMSFDPPELHFGLGTSAHLSSIRVLWPDGRATELKGTFPANRHYVVRRQAR